VNMMPEIGICWLADSSERGMQQAYCNNSLYKCL